MLCLKLHAAPLHTAREDTTLIQEGLCVCGPVGLLTCDAHDSHFLGGLIVEGRAQPAQGFPGVRQLDHGHAQRAAARLARCLRLGAQEGRCSIFDGLQQSAHSLLGAKCGRSRVCDVLHAQNCSTGASLRAVKPCIQTCQHALQMHMAQYQG